MKKQIFYNIFIKIFFLCFWIDSKPNEYLFFLLLIILLNLLWYLVLYLRYISNIKNIKCIITEIIYLDSGFLLKYILAIITFKINYIKIIRIIMVTLVLNIYWNKIIW